MNTPTIFFIVLVITLCCWKSNLDVLVFETIIKEYLGQIFVLFNRTKSYIVGRNELVLIPTAFNQHFPG